jgi:poly(A) polymerase
VIRLEGQDWLTDPPTAAVMDALEAEGGPDCARFVGGSVRNALMGRAVDDVDVATILTPDRVLAALKRAGLKSVPTGIEHGTVTAVSARRPVEITTLRRDVSTDGRRATVAFTGDWAEDAARRDFRLNALYADRNGDVFDPTGQGIDDALHGRIVFVGEAERRIREDYLRILRFFRFMAWYGRGEPDAAGLAACATLKDGMAQLSAERVSKELLKLLAAPDPVGAIRAMDRAGVLTPVLGTAGDVDRLALVVVASDDPLLRLSALWPDDPAFVAEKARALRLPRTAWDRLEAAAGPLELGDPTARGARRLIYGLGSQPARDRALKAAASPERNVVLQTAESWTPPRLPVGGHDVARLGVAAGPETGAVLRAFEESWIADDFATDGVDARLAAAVSAVRGR